MFANQYSDSGTNTVQWNALGDYVFDNYIIPSPVSRHATCSHAGIAQTVWMKTARAERRPRHKLTMPSMWLCNFIHPAPNAIQKKESRINDAHNPHTRLRTQAH